jgi:hypothetical protein
MAIDITERYKLILAEHHYASDFRVKIFTGWCAIYAALAAVFAWTHSTSKPLLWLVALFGLLITLLMWLADVRNRAALQASKDAGAAIEAHEDAGIPEPQRFFPRVRAETRFERVITHSFVINMFALVMAALFALAVWVLYSTKGELP